MKRLTDILDDDGDRIPRKLAANKLGISEQALANKLYHYRKLHPADYAIPLRKLRATHVAHNQLLDKMGNRISYAKAAAYLCVSVTTLYKLVYALRGVDPDIRAGAAISMGVLMHNLSVDGEIMVGYKTAEELGINT